jgi:hypothetical protein
MNERPAVGLKINCNENRFDPAVSWAPSASLTEQKNKAMIGKSCNENVRFLRLAGEC